MSKPTPLFRRAGGAAVVAALVAGTLVASASSAGAAESATTPQLKVLSYNVFLFSKNIYPNWGQDHRAQAIPAADFFQGNDVVVLQEAFDNSSSDALKSRAAAQYPYQTPVLGRSKSGWDATGGEYSSIAPEDGGVTILSKWPILRKEQYVFDDACGADWFSNKGFVYVALNVNGTKVHVVGTHTQANDSSCSSGSEPGIRAQQFQEIDAFLDAKSIPADEQVIVAGDFNVNLDSSEYGAMLTNAGLDPADARTGHPYSFDPQENTVAADRYPGGTRQNLDYVLHRKGHARPDAWRNNVVKEETAPWTVTSWGTDYTFTNLSDHYPVTAGDV